MATTRPYVLIGTPCYGGLVAQGFMESVLQLMTLAPQWGFDLTIAMNGQDSLITRSRNKIVAAFLDMPQATHLLFIDADIVFDPAYVARMLKFDQDVVAGMYPIKNIDWPLLRQHMGTARTDEQLKQAGLNYVGQPCVGAERETRDGFVTGTYAGTGFILIKRAVLERMIAAYPETKYALAHTFPRVTKQSENQYALFDCMIEPGSMIYLSEDFAFCRRWRQLGGKLWLDTESKLGHIGNFRFEGTPSVTLKLS